MTDINSVQSPPGGTATLAGRTVARIGYGAMQLDRLREDRDGAVRLLRRAIELGVDHIDTAQFYGNGFVNDVLRDALRPEDGVTIVTKVGADPIHDGAFPMRAAQRPEELRASVQDNLRALGLQQIPLVNLRRMEVGLNVSRSAEQVIDLDDQLAEMTALRDEGLIGAVGLSSITLDSLRRALPAGIACVQNAYSLIARDDEAMLDLCVAEGIAWVPFFPLGSAFPGLPKVSDEAEVQAIAEEVGASPAQVGLAWLLDHSPTVLLIPGTTSIEHLEANLAVGDVHLSTAATARLDRLSTREPQQH